MFESFGDYSFIMFKKSMLLKISYRMEIIKKALLNDYLISKDYFHFSV